MLVLGLNWSMHDASACLLVDGRVAAFAEEERFIREKHTSAFPANALRFCLDRAGVEMKDIDHAAFFWNPYLHTLRRGVFMLRYFPASLARIREQRRIWSGMVSTERILRQQWGFQGRFHFVSHYDAHSASAFFLSPFDRAAILIVDGNGELSTTRYAVGEGHGFRVLGEVPYPHSIGLIYASVTSFLGFRPVAHEGKVMGLSAYGRPRLIDFFRHLLRFGTDGDYRVDTRYFNYHTHRHGWVSPRFVREVGPAREPESELTGFHEDVASSLQTFTEEAVLRLLRDLQARTGERNLCYSGGVALNSVLNGKILGNTAFEDMFLMPVANDAGASLGAALFINSRHGGQRPEPMANAYWGPEFDEAACRSALEAHGLPFRTVDRVEEEAARRLADGGILGWFQGRMEAGPRALGNRSILADPRRPDMKDTLNARVKHREPFRPFAPSVMEEHLSDWFAADRPSPYMMRVYPVRPEKKDRIPAVLHVDGTGRVQTVSQPANPRYYALLECFHRLTGVPMVLNTSFNVRGEPIVCTPEDAVQCFLGTEMDFLVMGNLVAVKTAHQTPGGGPA